MSELGKPFLKKSENKKNRKYVKNAAWEQKIISEKWKFVSNKKLCLAWTMNRLGKPFRKKKSIQKIEKKSKNQREIAACEQKTTTNKANLCSNIVFSLYYKIREKKFTPQSHSLFRSISCFGVTKITTPIWVKRSWNVWTDLKKRQRPNTIQIPWIVKKESA